jgi:hypothetical protein
MKEFAKLGLLRHANLEYFKKQVNEAIKDMDSGEIERIQREMQETIDDHTNNRDAHYEKEMEQLKEIGPMVDPLNAEELVAIFNETNRIEINSETLLEEIRVALEPKNLENRDRMIRDVVYHNYLKDARLYERQRQMAKLQLLQNPTDFSTMHALREMQDIPTFFEKYVEIVSTMVKEEAPDYQMKPMVGLSKEDALNLQTNHFSSFSFKKALEIQLLQVLKLDNPDLLSVVTLADITDDPRKLDYKNESADVRRRLQETYLGKKIVEDHLKSQGFFWKLGNRAEVKLMKNFIKAAEDTLAAAKFPNAAKEAAEERGFLGVDYKELSVIRSRTDDIFLTPEEKELRRQKQEARERKQGLIKAANEKPLDDRFFDVHFRPPFTLAEFNEQYHRMKEIGKACISGYDGLGKAKAVFNQNYKKFEAIKDVVRGKRHMGVDQEIEFKKNAVKGFEKSEDEFLKENADYEAITYEQAKSMAKPREQAPTSTEKVEIRSTMTVVLDDNNLKKEEVAPQIVEDELKKDEPVINK